MTETLCYGIVFPTPHTHGCGLGGAYVSESYVTGSGANGVALLLPTQAHLTHPAFNRLMRRAGLNPEAFLIHVGFDNLVATLSARPDIKVVVPMGDAMLSRTLGEHEMLRWRGRPVWHPSLQRHTIATFSPLDLIYTRAPKDGKKAPLHNPPRFTRVVIEDLHYAIQVAQQGFTRDETRDYLYDPSTMAFYDWVLGYFSAHNADPRTYLSFDIETPYKQKSKDEGEMEEAEMDSNILRISFSYKTHHAVTVPWDAAHLPGIRMLLGSVGRKVVWNGVNFDLPVIKKAGVAVHGQVYDFMDGFKVLHSDLPRGLEWVTSFHSDMLPWKHLNNSDPQLYSCIDSDAALRNAIGIEAELKKKGQWETFLRHSVYLMPILSEAGERGNYVDEQERQALEKEMAAEEKALIAEVQTVVPDHLKPRKRYKKQPEGVVLQDNVFILTDLEAGTTRRFEPVNTMGKVKKCSFCGEEGITKGEHFKGGKKNVCKTMGGEVIVAEGRVQEWDEVLPFNPNSSDQLIKYMKHYGHPVGEIWDDPEGESADSKHLKKLVKKYGTKHPVYDLTLRVHKVGKALGTYVRGLAPDAHGKVHTTYVNSPSTWRLGSRDVNMQNQGKRGSNPYAKRSRKVIVASPGHVLVQADSSSIEAVMVGRFMGDKNYEELAKQSIHAWLCCKKLGWDFTPENVEIIKKSYKDLYDQMKVTNHMTNYGGTPPVLVEQFPEVFPTLKSARDAQQYIFDALPQLKAWHHEMRVRAQKETFLESPWKHRHEFFDVFTKYPDGRIKLGKDAKRAIAFTPQNGAGCFMRDNLLIMGTKWEEIAIDPDLQDAVPLVPEEDAEFLYSGKWRQYMPACVSVHDGYTLDVPAALQQEACDYLERLLTRPIVEMGGLRVGCEIEVGKNWLEMKTVKVVKV